jgi:hypothetical protein
MRGQVLREKAKGNVTIYLPADVLERCRAAAVEDNRSLSNYLAGLLERAHPPEIARSGQVHIEDAIAAAVKGGGGGRAAKHK